MKKILIPVKEINQLNTGTIIRRKNKKKDQQGYLINIDDNNLILINVIDLINGKLFANEGILKPLKSDRLYYYNSTFKNNPLSKEAIALIAKWPLYKKNKTLQSDIIQFVCSSFVPEQILEWKKNDSLSMLFVPIKQKFRLGNLKERRNLSRVYKEKFKMWLDSLQNGEHIAYVAFIPQHSVHNSKFYTIGTSAHRETENNLFHSPFSFKPTHGGYIKATGFKNNKKHFYVDAGSDYIGRGVKAPLHIAKNIVKALQNIYPDYEFTPLEGRGAL